MGHEIESRQGIGRLEMKINHVINALQKLAVF
jgi:hypothetical protein